MLATFCGRPGLEEIGSTANETIRIVRSAGATANRSGVPVAVKCVDRHRRLSFRRKINRLLCASSHGLPRIPRPVGGGLQLTTRWKIGSTVLDSKFDGVDESVTLSPGVGSQDMSTEGRPIVANVCNQ